MKFVQVPRLKHFKHRTVKAIPPQRSELSKAHGN